MSDTIVSNASRAYSDRSAGVGLPVGDEGERERAEGGRDGDVVLASRMCASSPWRVTWLTVSVGVVPCGSA